MRQKTDLKRKVLLLAGSGLIIAVVFLFIKCLFPVFSPFIIAYVLAAVIDRPVTYLQKKIGGKKGIYAAVLVTVTGIVLCVVLGVLLYAGINEIKAFVKNYEYNIFAARQFASRVCLGLDQWLGLNDGCCFGYLDNCRIWLEKNIGGSTLSKIFGTVISFSVPFITKVVLVSGGIFVCFIAVVYLSGNMEDIRNWKDKCWFREEIALVETSLKLLVNVYFKVQFLILCVNSTLCIIALLLIKNPYAVLVGLIIGIVDVLPFFGTGTILIPWAVILLLGKHFQKAAILITVYILTYFVREIMESKLMGKRMGISPFVMLMVIFVGIMVYGIMGFILGPVTYCIVKPLILYLKTILERGKIVNI